MAYHDTHSTPADALPHRLLAGIKALFATFGRAMIAAASANRRVKLAEQLQDKSDQELAALGIRREDIVRYVFRDMLDV
ncbi:DUF1127 domain-containing protein [Roseobacter weihaiensis]|uniref:DUF1127 domain-containing protein n=1 Tax=Roseobacter weihaiensis TaxID=2763262 RepID=UPI001D0A9A02|nr:DUF1127 domain-containing protein [Roseobacter sp. H9]